MCQRASCRKWNTMQEEPSEVEVVNAFEECWKELLQEYGAKRLFNLYCSEADIQLHLASKLLEKMRFPLCVYVEFPIPFEIDDFIYDRNNLGRPRRKMKKGEGMVADIVVMGAKELVPSIIVELKYSPLIWNFLPIIEAAEGKATRKQRETVKLRLKGTISHMTSWEEYGPSQRLILSYSKNVNKIIQLIKDFREKYNVSVYAYLCVIDEIYPGLGPLLEKEINKYNPPDRFRLRFHHHSVKEWLKDQLNKL